MCSNVDVDMLRVTMMNRVSCHIDSTDFVPVDHRQKKNMWYMKFLQKVVLHNGMFHNVLFCLCTRTGDCTLTLERPCTMAPDYRRQRHSYQTCSAERRELAQPA